jgi:hypothetical protein
MMVKDCQECLRMLKDEVKEVNEVKDDYEWSSMVKNGQGWQE